MAVIRTYIELSSFSWGGGGAPIKKCDRIYEADLLFKAWELLLVGKELLQIQCWAKQNTISKL